MEIYIPKILKIINIWQNKKKKDYFNKIEVGYRLDSVKFFMILG